MPTCDKCGTNHSPGDKFCTNCGNPFVEGPSPPHEATLPPLPQQTVEPPRCSKCGKGISQSSRFSPWCGNIVTPETPPATPPTTASPLPAAAAPQTPTSPVYYPPTYYPSPPPSHRPYTVAIAVLLVAVVLLSGFVANIEFFHFGIPTPPRNPYSVMTTRESQNWSGFVLQSLSGSVTDVKGTWTIPQIDCASISGQSYAAQWVGIDGAGGSNTVEQAGTEYDCSNGVSSVFAWYEWYPARGRLLRQPGAHAGDVVTVEVSWDGRQFTASINDATQGWTYAWTNSTIGSIATRSTAEWVVEAPSVSGSIASLTNFNKLYFSKSYATNSGATGPMGSFSLDEVTMVDTSGSMKARPVLPLWNDGTSFSVWWLKAGP